MIINHTYKFVFVHVPKTAGTSVSTLLSSLTRYCDQEIGATPFGQQVGPAYTSRFGLAKHSTAAKIREVTGNDVWRDYLSFGFVRNPFDRCLSCYKFLRRWDSPNKDFNQRIRAFESFADFVLSGMLDEPSPGELLQPQLHWVAPRGEQRVSVLGRVETLENDLRDILERVGAPTSLVDSMPRLNQSSLPDPLPDVDTAVLDRIRERYRKDFRAFGYPPDAWPEP